MTKPDRTPEDRESTAQLEKPVQRPVDRASESVVSPQLAGPAPWVPPGAVSSGEIEIPPGSFVPTPDSLAAISPPSSVTPEVSPEEPGLGRRGMSLRAMVAVGCGVFAVLVLLTLLLFR